MQPEKPRRISEKRGLRRPKNVALGGPKKKTGRKTAAQLPPGSSGHLHRPPAGMQHKRGTSWARDTCCPSVTAAPATLGRALESKAATAAAAAAPAAAPLAPACMSAAGARLSARQQPAGSAAQRSAEQQAGASCPSCLLVLGRSFGTWEEGGATPLTFAAAAPRAAPAPAALPAALHAASAAAPPAAASAPPTAPLCSRARTRRRR